MRTRHSGLRNVRKWKLLCKKKRGGDKPRIQRSHRMTGGRGERERQEDVLPVFHKQKCDTRFSPCLFVQILLREGLPVPCGNFVVGRFAGRSCPPAAFQLKNRKKSRVVKLIKLRSKMTKSRKNDSISFKND